MPYNRVQLCKHLGLIVSKGSVSLNQISEFEPENDTKSITSIIGPKKWVQPYYEKVQVFQDDDAANIILVASTPLECKRIG